MFSTRQGQLTVSLPSDDELRKKRKGKGKEVVEPDGKRQGLMGWGSLSTCCFSGTSWNRLRKGEDVLTPKDLQSANGRFLEPCRNEN